MTYYADNARHLICLPPRRAKLLAMADDLGIGRHWYHKARALHHIDIPKRDIERVLADPRVTVLSTRELLRIASEHLDSDCDDIWHCRMLHRVMTRRAERDLLRYPGEWVLFDEREGVKYHGAVPKDLLAEADHDVGAGVINVNQRRDLILHRVPEPGVAYVL